MTDMNETTKNSSPVAESSLKIQLGDIIKLSSPDNDIYNDQTFVVDFIDKSKMVLINTESMVVNVIRINDDGTLNESTITGIDLLYRNENPGYAKQHNLLPGTWINIYFGGDIPAIMTGQIIDLDEDMIEVKTYPEKDIVYINFNYAGIPEDLPIDLIEIREKPEQSKAAAPVEEEVDIIGQEDGDNENIVISEKEPDGSEIVETIPSLDIQTDEEVTTIGQAKQKVDEHLHRMLVEADDIIFGLGEEFEPVTTNEEKPMTNVRYSIEAQCNDLLDEMLSTIPDSERTRKVLKNIHTMIERFKQLRSLFSIKDQYDNVLGPMKKEATWKPLTEQLTNFNHNLYWLLPVVKMVKKVYNVSGDNEDMPSDIIPLKTLEEVDNMEKTMELYRSNTFPDDQSKYTYLARLIDEEQRPFNNPNPEMNRDVIYTTHVGTNIQTIVDNLERLYSSVISNDTLASRRFVIQKYNLGEKSCALSKLDKKTMTYHLKSITQPDQMSVNSVLMLQEPVVRFSKINLPSTTILERSNLNNAFLNYWELLKTYTRVRSVYINNDEPTLIDDTSFLKHITQFKPSNPSSVHGSAEEYDNFVEKIVPTTKKLFEATSQYLSGKMSFLDAIHYMEPFLIHTDDITFMQFKYITEVIGKEISKRIRKHVERGHAFFKLKTMKTTIALNPSAEGIYNAPGKLSTEIFNSGYDYTKATTLTNSELLFKILSKDSSRLYSSAIAFDNIHLMFPESIAHIFNETTEENKKMLEEYSNKDDCKKYVLAKQYTSVEELEGDNNRDIYYDKRYDTTRYSILDNDKYQKEMVSKSHDEFIEFLVKKLEKDEKLSTDDAVYLAETLITGMKKVRDGDYAFVFEFGPTEDASITYYERVGNIWKNDPNVDKSSFLTDDDALCNVQKDCINVNNKCESTSLNKTQLEEKALKTIMKEFDEKYLSSKERMEGKLKYDFEYNNSIIGRLAEIHTNNMFKYNNLQLAIGKSNVETLSATESPYYKGLQIIIGQGDFTKKQNDIIRFCMQFTRKPLENKGEEEGWRYCIKTSVPLIPEFRYTMAAAFINDPGRYLEVIEKLKSTIGKISDDGNAWVDKHSGQVIVVDNFVMEDTYTSGGFKDVSRDILEKDASKTIVNDLNKKLSMTHEMKITSNIIDALSSVMGVQIEDHRDFISDISLKIFHSKLPNENDYKKKIMEASKNKKTLPSYNEVYNTLLLYNVLSAFLIGVQTSIPPITTRRTFPGCVSSFRGFPFEGVGDDSAVNYVACVSYHIRNSTEPWKVLLKKKQTFIADTLKNTIQKNYLNHTDVIHKFNEKAEYLLSNPPESIPEEHNVASLWEHFLPPLVDFKITNLHPLTTEFKRKLLQDIKSGYSGQREDILVVRSKIIYYSLALQERIQKIVGKEPPILKNGANEPFMDNSCCSTHSTTSAIDYFINKDKEIEVYNNQVKALTLIIEDIDMITRGGLFYSPINTKVTFPPLNSAFAETTIYIAFITYCKFNSVMPTPSYLEKFCEEKPLTIKPNESIREMITKIQNDGRIYTNDSLIKMFQAVSRENIVQTLFNVPKSDYINEMRRLLVEDEDNEDEDTKLNDEFVDLMLRKLDTFDMTDIDTEDMREFKNFLAKKNDEMSSSLKSFLSEHRTHKIKTNVLNDLIDKLVYFEDDEGKAYAPPGISDTQSYNAIQIMRTFIFNIIKVYPTIILNKVDYSTNNINKYWKLSPTHQIEIKNITSEDLEKLRPHYSEPTTNTILETIKTRGEAIMKLMNTTPYFTKIVVNGDEKESVFDHRTSMLLLKYYVFKSLIDYVNLTDDENMLYVEVNQTNTLENVFTVEGIEDQQRHIDVAPQVQESELLLQGDKILLKRGVANLLVTYLETYNSTLKIVNMSYDAIMDKVFKHSVIEKTKFTSKLAGKTDEERGVDNILKSAKLGDWNKGLQKGIRYYDPDVYDEEREFMKDVEHTQREMLLDPNVTENNVEQYMLDAQEDERAAREIDEDVYSMNHMDEDYADGNYGGDELDYDE